MASPGTQPLDPTRQLAFRQLLFLARPKWLEDALKDALTRVDPIQLRAELAHHVPPDVQAILQVANIRDEYVFPTPVVLEAMPSLVGYYRLLLGQPRKSFYVAKDAPMKRFRSMEDDNVVTPAQLAELPKFCTEMSGALAELIRGMSPTVTSQDIAQLPVLILGSQLQGGNNNIIGRLATQRVFEAVAAVVAGHTLLRRDKPRRIVVQNPGQKIFEIAVGGDPDIRIQERTGPKITPTAVSGGILTNLIAIEIKGGTDASNQYNRCGEAEKSHNTAASKGYHDFWTVIATRTLNAPMAAMKSPTTREWFNIDEVVATQGTDWDRFCNRIAHTVGIPSPCQGSNSAIPIIHAIGEKGINSPL